MSLESLQEFVVGHCLVRVYSNRVDLPGVSGWVGVWAIYRHPRSEEHPTPLRIGDTDIEQNEAIAIGMAKAMASAVAATL